MYIEGEKILRANGLGVFWIKRKAEELIEHYEKEKSHGLEPTCAHVGSFTDRQMNWVVKFKDFDERKKIIEIEVTE